MATPKTTSTPVVGFNHNIRHKNRVFHIQTEDSGLPHAHYITHLFVGGNILASKKTSYAELADDDEMQKKVRALMEDQHKSMLRNLINGTYDEVAGQFESRSYAPGQLEGDATPYASVEKPMESPEARARAGTAAPAFAPAPVPPSPPPPQAYGKPAPPPPKAPAAPVKPPPLPKHAHASGLAPPGGSTRPPPPPQPPPVLKPLPPEVLAALELKEQPAIHDDHPETIFGEDLISEKSLDEVILAYLATVDDKK